MPQDCAIHLQALPASASEASVPSEDCAWSGTCRASMMCSLQLVEHQRNPEQWQLVYTRALLSISRMG